MQRKQSWRDREALQPVATWGKVMWKGDSGHDDDDDDDDDGDDVDDKDDDDDDDDDDEEEEEEEEDDDDDYYHYDEKIFLSLLWSACCSYPFVANW